MTSPSHADIRRIAAHQVLLEDGTVLQMAVVTLSEGKVLSVSPLCGEQPMTEWLGGEIEVRQGRAYWKGKYL